MTVTWRYLEALHPAPNPTPSPLWGHNVTLTIDVTLWLSCGRYVTTLDMAPYQLVEYVVGTLRYTLTPSLTWALGVNLSKFWPSDTAYRYGLINSSPCVLSYHYKQRLGVDVSMHPCPLGLPAGGHSKEAVQCYNPPTLLGGRPGRHDHAGTGWHEMNAVGIPKGYWVQESTEVLRGTLDGTFPQRFYVVNPSSKECTGGIFKFW